MEQRRLFLLYQMRWLAKYKEGNNNGDTRVKRRFAWWPVRISNKMVWLEFFELLQMYQVLNYTAAIDGTPLSFRQAQWINLSKRLSA